MDGANLFEHSSLQEERCDRSLTLHRDPQRSELSILPKNAPTLSGRSLYEFRCSAHPTRTKADPAHSNRSLLVIKIHPSFLLKNGGGIDVWVGSLVCDVNDTVAAELAQGLMNISGVEMSTDTLFHLVQLLCARLEVAMLEKSGYATLKHFEEWQVAELTQSLTLAMERRLSIASIARRCCLSVCHFSRLFKAAYGLPLHKFVTNERIRQAQAQLTSTTKPIAEIALDCGFADQSSFTRRFTAVAGIAPAMWRKQADCERIANLSSARPILNAGCV